MADQQGRTPHPFGQLPGVCDVVSQRRERVLRRHHSMPRLVQPRDYVPPVRTVTKRTVHENNVDFVRHDATSSESSRQSKKSATVIPRAVDKVEYEVVLPARRRQPILKVRGACNPLG
jgi:hypothetical protein